MIYCSAITVMLYETEIVVLLALRHVSSSALSFTTRKQ
jgi:hypothetical protein